jgi:protein-tyrosine phosphatase
MAVAFLRDHLDFRGVTVSSGGFARENATSPDDTIEAMKEYRFDLSSHRSVKVTRDAVESADLVLAMEYDHGRKLAAMAPQTIDRIYTLPEFVDRAEALPADEGETLAEWRVRLHDARPAHPHLGSRAEWEVIDPYRRPLRVHRQAAEEIGDLCRRVAAALDAPLTVAETAPGSPPHR